MSSYTLLPFIYFAACFGAIGFQFALIFGAPWGPITQGGKHQGKLPATGRIVAGASVFVLLGMAFAITSAAGWSPNWPSWTSWTALGVQSASTLANWITPSRPERLLWGPITLVMFIVAAVIVIAP